MHTVRRSPTNRHDNCYFFMMNMSQWNRLEKYSWHYTDKEVPVSVLSSLPKFVSCDDLFVKAKEIFILQSQ